MFSPAVTHHEGGILPAGEIMTAHEVREVVRHQHEFVLRPAVAGALGEVRPDLPPSEQGVVELPEPVQSLELLLDNWRGRADVLHHRVDHGRREEPWESEHIDLVETYTGHAQGPVQSTCRKTGSLLLPVEPLLLGRCDEFPVHHDGDGGVMTENAVPVDPSGPESAPEQLRPAGKSVVADDDHAFPSPRAVPPPARMANTAEIPLKWPDGELRAVDAARRVLAVCAQDAVAHPRPVTRWISGRNPGRNARVRFSLARSTPGAQSWECA